MSSTALEGGLAIPHCKTAVLDARAAVLARSQKGVTFGAPGGEPTHLLVALITPVFDPGGHVKLLAHISRIFRDASLREAPGAAEMRELVLAAAGKTR